MPPKSAQWPPKDPPRPPKRRTENEHQKRFQKGPKWEPVLASEREARSRLEYCRKNKLTCTSAEFKYEQTDATKCQSRVCTFQQLQWSSAPLTAQPRPRPLTEGAWIETTKEIHDKERLLQQMYLKT